MRIYDISLPISPAIPVWLGDPPVVLERISSMDAGAHDNVSRLECSVHTGTHVDAPHHFLNDGRTVDTLSLDVLTGSVQVIRIPDEVGLITSAILDQAKVRAGTLRLLLKTRNSSIWGNSASEFVRDFVALSIDGADWLVKTGVKLVGIDYLSIAPFKQSLPIHRALLEPGIVILEGLDLRAISPGFYDLYCLPLNLVGSDGGSRTRCVDRIKKSCRKACRI
ncbi:MAG: cyclase family protein [Anaerolineales bacterium]